MTEAAAHRVRSARLVVARKADEKNRVTTRLTPQGWLAIGASFGFSSALIWQQPIPWAAFLGFTLMAGIFFSMFRLPRHLRRTRAEWLLPQSVHAGEEATVGAALSAEGQVPPVSLEAWDPDYNSFHFVADVPGLGVARTRVAWVVKFPVRGMVTMPPLVIHGEQPFGFLTGSICPGHSRDYLVYPALGKLNGDIEQDLVSWLTEGTRSKEVGDDELSHLRRYRPGDPPRRIHWRASARARNLLVTERQAPVSRRLAFVIDTQTRSTHCRILEKTIATAATLADYLIRRGWTLSIHGQGLPAEGLVGDRETLMAGLAVLQPSMEAFNLVEALPAHTASLVFLLTSQSIPQSTLVRSLLPEQMDLLVSLPRGLR